MARINLPIQRPWIPYIILVITLTLTVISTYYVGRATYIEDQLRFLNAVQDTKNSIEDKLNIYIAVLRGIAGLYAVEQDMTQHQFETYVNRIHLKTNYSGTLGIGYIQQVNNEDLNNYIQSVQNEDPYFSIKPKGNRSVYEVVRFFETSNNQITSSGYDMATDPTRKAAMDKARDTGAVVTSGKVTLLSTNHGKKISGFLLFIPLYSGGETPQTIEQRRSQLVGFIYSPFETNMLLNDSLENKSLPQLLDFQIYDGDEINKNTQLYDSNSDQKQSFPNFEPKFHTTRSLNIANETWTINFTNHPQFETESEEDLSSYIFLGGIFVSIILFALSRSQYMARTRAEIAASQLQDSQKELEKAIGLRDNFISIASHELKTPVTSLKVYAEMLLRQFSKKGDTKTTDYLSKIIRQIDKLTLLIQDLLDVSRIHASRLTFRKEKFDLNEMTKEVIESTQQISSRHTIILKGVIHKNVWGDKERISQVLINLLTNALKYSPKANKVIVTLREDKKEASISVQDFGIGINKNHQKKIFDRFYRISDTNEQTFPGLGIGLFISHSIIKRHGGKILLKSEKGEGSTFAFTLPYNKKHIE